jgi:drug/metabolite transporter (DMT)-like permease
MAVIATSGYVCILYAMTMSPVSHVAPAREVSMLFAAILGGKLLGEGDRFWRIVGAALVAVGVVALAWKN